MLFIDLETRSTRNVTVCGAHELAQDPDLRLLCASYAMGGDPVKTWDCAFANGDPDLAEPVPADLLDALNDPDCLILSWNAAFERLILNAVRKRYQLPPLPIERFFCIMTWARCFNLPGSLATCTKTWLPAEDAKLSGKPTAWMWSTKKPLLPEHEKDYREGQVVYCEADVSSMREIYKLLPNPTDEFIAEYHAAEYVNDRGCMVDRRLINAAITLAPVVDDEIRTELDEITGGEVKPRGPSLRNWLDKVLPKDLTELLWSNKKFRQGYGWGTRVRPSTDKNVRARLLEAMEEYEGMEDVRDALALYDEANRAAVTKYAAARDRTDPEESCLRGQYLFSGASQTGRFSATGVQVHNLIRMVPKDALVWIDAILSCDPDHIRKVTGMTVNQALSRVIRTAFLAEVGHVLVWGDWSAIEARMLPWLSGDEAAERVLDAYRENKDLYIEEAAGIYGIPPEQVDKDQRQAGKVVILACGFNGGVGAYQAMAKNYGLKIPDAEASRIVKAWRANNPWARRFWRALEKAAILAIRNPNVAYPAGRIKFVFVPDLLRGTLLAFLPSGRPLAYPEASVITTEKFGKDTDTIIFRHPTYGMTDTYGGKIAENVTQGESASLLRALIVRQQKRTVLHTHDEVVLEVRRDLAAAVAADLHADMIVVPDWAPGLPLAAEVEWGERYKIEEGKHKHAA